MNIIDSHGITFPAGFRAAAANCGFRNGRNDLALVVSDTPASVAGAFTKNRFCAAPVLLCKNHLEGGSARAFLCNSGNANAATGDAGYQAAETCVDALARKLDCPVNDVYMCSTGKIGIPFPAELVTNAVDALVGALSPEGGSAAAKAILTTDTCVKQRAVEITIDGKPVRIGGMAKGSGMIMPDMATMLAFITTDAAIDSAHLQRLLSRAVTVSFNRVTVDGDTSTNDTVLVMANGASGAKITPQNEAAFYTALEAVCIELAKMLAIDGEGATKFVTISVEGCRTEADADAIARTVANSPLVKTALYGSSPNWGRVAAAAGRAGVAFDPDAMDIYFNGILTMEKGMPRAFDKAELLNAFKQHDLEIRITLPDGEAKATVWTCDFSHKYVDINVDYN
jgi:glutamate N-acetyltransferase/amino-acid N-acetyltransferase